MFGLLGFAMLVMQMGIKHRKGFWKHGGGYSVSLNPTYRASDNWLLVDEGRDSGIPPTEKIRENALRAKAFLIYFII